MALSELVSVRYGGSLKAEHGTGRAIAPFVEREWGTTAYRMMHRIKALFDPEGLLNPGVLLNADPRRARQEPEADAAGRRDRRPLHRVRLLRAGLPQPSHDAVARASASW